jgi:hypothetical protein
VEKHGFEKLSFHAPGPIVPAELGNSATGFPFPDTQKEPQVLAVWRRRQYKIGMTETRDSLNAIDGVPLAQTVARLKDQGHDDGMWVKWNPALRKSTTRLGEGGPVDAPDTWSSGIIENP